MKHGESPSACLPRDPDIKLQNGDKAHSFHCPSYNLLDSIRWALVIVVLAPQFGLMLFERRAAARGAVANACET